MRIFLCASLVFLSACAAGSGAQAPSTGGPFALRAGERLDMVSGAKPIDRIAADRFRRMRLEDWPTRRSRRPKGAPAKIHAFWAIWPRTDTGVQAEQVIWPAMAVKAPSTVIYAPTLYAAIGACIESTTSYQAAPRGLQIWAYDWCAKSPNGKVGASLDVNAAFLRTYTRAAGEARSYLVRVEQTDVSTNEWTDYLYNYATAKWNVFYRSQGTADAYVANDPAGWDAYESYSDVDAETLTSNMCRVVGSVGPIVSEGLRVRTPSGWELANKSNSYVGMDGNSFYCPLLFSVPKANYEYSVSRR
jgi:hypothetical protein